jgi:hypothetical protein
LPSVTDTAESPIPAGAVHIFFPQPLQAGDARLDLRTFGIGRIFRFLLSQFSISASICESGSAWLSIWGTTIHADSLRTSDQSAIGQFVV